MLDIVRNGLLLALGLAVGAAAVNRAIPNPKKSADHAAYCDQIERSDLYITIVEIGCD